MKTEHTPTPWKVNPPPRLKPLHLTGNVISGNGEVITQVNSGMGRAEANAEFICRAVNSHADLLEACKAAKSALQGLKESGDEQDWDAFQPFHAPLELLRAAIQKAEGAL